MRLIKGYTILTAPDPTISSYRMKRPVGSFSANPSSSSSSSGGSVWGSSASTGSIALLSLYQPTNPRNCFQGERSPPLRFIAGQRYGGC
uniref:Uncharacterized protein n=1 Tax=Arundo donax TaxID=35708 RepID=A0A0A9GZG8_ARUDO